MVTEMNGTFKSKSGDVGNSSIITNDADFYWWMTEDVANFSTAIRLIGDIGKTLESTAVSAL